MNRQHKTAVSIFLVDLAHDNSKCSMSLIRQEIEEIKNFNATLEATLSSLTTISDNLSVFANNLDSSKKLSNIYTDIYNHDRRLQQNINNIGICFDERKLDEDIKDLEQQIESLKSQLSK